MVGYKPEELTIIGGGLGGCLSALFAARVKDEQGRPRYHVTLLEAGDHILNGASVTAARLHLGGEYPKDAKTANHCLWGAALWKLIFPQKGLFTHEPPTRFLIAKETEQKALTAREANADPNRILTDESEAFKRSGLTVDEYGNHYRQNVQANYEVLISNIMGMICLDAQAAERLGITLPPQTDVIKALLNDSVPSSGYLRNLLDDYQEPLARRVAEAFFGDPDKCFAPLSKHDMRYYGGHMAGGFATKEPGLDIVGYLSSIEPALKEAGVDIVTQARVDKIDESKDHAGYSIHCENGSTFNTDQLIQAAWEGGFELDAPHRAPKMHKKVQAYRRAMAVVDTSNIRTDQLPPPSFVLKDEAGGMFCPLNNDVALVYCPMDGLGHMDTYELDSANHFKRHVPSDWKKPLSQEEKKALLERYKEHLVKGPFPFLKDATFANVFVRTTLNFDKDIDRRRHHETEEIKPGFHALYPSKLTLAPASAIQAVQNLRQRSDFKAQGRGSDPIENPVALNKACITVLKDRDGIYDLRRVLKLNHPEQVSAFIEQRKPELGEALGNIPGARISFYGIPAKTPNKSRSFGLGFGPCKVSVYTESGPKTGPLFDRAPEKNKTVCQQVSAWLADDSGKSLAEYIGAERLAPALANRLLHTDMLTLVKFMDSPEKLIPSSASRRLLFGSKNLSQLPEDTWRIMKNSRPELPDFKTVQNLETLEDLPPLMPGRKEIMAALLPVLFTALDAPAQEAVAADMAAGLKAMGEDKAFFAPLADPDVNRVIIKGAEKPLTAKRIFNNMGRTLQVELQPPGDPKATDLSIRFQGREFYPVQFHFHRNRTLRRDAEGRLETDASGHAQTEAGVMNNTRQKDGKFEFQLYRDRAHEEACKQGTPDPNDHNDTVGELHSIFMTPKDEHGHRTALALCAHVKLGGENREMAPYINMLANQNSALSDNQVIKRDNIPFKALACFNHGNFGDGELPEAPFASLQMGDFTTKDGRVVLKEGASDIFYRGVHVVHLPDAQSVTISPKQMEILENTQPILTALPDDQGIWPFPRAVKSGILR